MIIFIKLYIATQQETTEAVDCGNYLFKKLIEIQMYFTQSR